MGTKVNKLEEFEQEFKNKFQPTRKSVFDGTDISSLGGLNNRWEEIPEESDENSSFEEVTPRWLDEQEEEKARLQEEMVSSKWIDQKDIDIIVKNAETPKSFYNSTVASSKKESL